MPRLSQSAPKYRKHKASGQAFVELNGQRHYLGPHGTRSSKDQYDRLVGEWLVQGRRLAPNCQEITVVELCTQYRRFAETYYVKNGKPTCLHRIQQAVKATRQLYGQQPVSQFGPTSLKTIRQQLIDRGLSRSYINELVDCIRRMFKWAAAEELIAASIPQSLSMVAGLRRGKTEARETAPVLPVDDRTVDATLTHLPQVVADMVRVQRLTGMRPHEVCNLRPVDLDRSGEVWFYYLPSHKAEHHGRQRVVPIGMRAQKILLPYLDRRQEEFCFSPAESEAKRRAARHKARTTPIRCGHRPGSHVKRKPLRKPGDHYNVSSYRRAIHRGCDKAFPVPEAVRPDRAETQAWRRAHRWSPNRLRHSAATEIRRRFGLEAAQVVLGHAAANVTQLYAERDLAKGAEVARLIG